MELILLQKHDDFEFVCSSQKVHSVFTKARNRNIYRCPMISTVSFPATTKHLFINEADENT
jgi:hypothetical protein